MTDFDSSQFFSRRSFLALTGGAGAAAALAACGGTSSPANFTLPAGLSILQGAYTTNYPVIMAGAVVASVPVIVLFIAAQRHVVESVARSGLKG